MSERVPVITVDGPSGSGKGTVCRIVAQRLGWHLLDSGALYRLVGLKAGQMGIGLDDAHALSNIASTLQVEFKSRSSDDLLIFLDNQDVTSLIRLEEAGYAASKVAQYQCVRDALLDFQRNFAKLPGLVADGRDMGTVVFPCAFLKIFLTASREERAKRRYKQLNPNENSGNLAALLREIDERDRRDSSRSVAPLQAASDAIEIDSTDLSIEQVVSGILSKAKESGLIV